MNRILKQFKIIQGWWWYQLKECPECNSTAPYLYDCPVCEYNRVPMQYWWARFIDHLDGRALPTFLVKCRKHKNCGYIGTYEQMQNH